MNFEAQKTRLGDVERDLAKSEARVARQILRIERLRQAQRDVRLAEGLLRRLEMARQADQAQRTEVLRNIADLEAAPHKLDGTQKR